MTRKFRFFALALALVMCFASAGTVLANSTALNNNGAIVAPDEDNPVQTSIRKVLRLPVGTTTPDATFKFDAKKVSVDDDSSTEALGTMPDLNALNDLSVTYTATNTAANDPETNTMSIVLDTGNIFAGVTFPHAGVFVYEISEIEDTNDDIDANAPDEILIYSKAVYTLRVYVANNEDYTETFIHAIAIIVDTPDIAGPEDDGDDDDENGENNAVVKVDQMIFTNDYVKTNGPEDPEDPDPVNHSTLSVSKTVTGDLGNRELYFDYTMTLTPPILLRDVPLYYRAYVVEGGEVIDPEDNAAEALIGTDEDGDSFIRISTSGTTAFKLKHGQRLVFVDTPVGTMYTVTEAAATGYRPSIIVTTDGSPGAVIGGTQVNVELSTGVLPQRVGESTNIAAFTNERTSIVPTGVNINDLPFLGLIALPIGALIGFIGIKSRKRNYTACK